MQRCKTTVCVCCFILQSFNFFLGGVHGSSWLEVPACSSYIGHEPEKKLNTNRFKPPCCVEEGSISDMKDRHAVHVLKEHEKSYYSIIQSHSFWTDISHIFYNIEYFVWPYIYIWSHNIFYNNSYYIEFSTQKFLFFTMLFYSLAVGSFHKQLCGKFIFLL